MGFISKIKALKKYSFLLKGVLLLVFIVLLYGFSASRNKLKKIDKINIEFENGDNLFITYEMVNKLLIQNYDKLQSQPKENIILNKLENSLLSNKMIENAEVYLSVNGELGATIIQKTPIARVNQNGKAYYIDRKGDRMPLSTNYSARVPILEGNFKETIDQDSYRLALLIYKDEFLSKQIVGIKRTNKNEFILKTRVGDQEIELGNLNRINRKVEKLKVFYQKIIRDSTLYKYKKINVVYENQVVCTKN